jgi:hypothetical protein
MAGFEPAANAAEAHQSGVALSRYDGESERTVRAGFGLWRSVWRSAGSTFEAFAHRPELGAGGPGGGWLVTASERQNPLVSSDLCGRAELAHDEVPRAVRPAARTLGAVSSTPRATSAGALALWRSSASERTRLGRTFPCITACSRNPGRGHHRLVRTLASRRRDGRRRPCPRCGSTSAFATGEKSRGPGIRTRPGPRPETRASGLRSGGRQVRVVFIGRGRFREERRERRVDRA